MDFYQFLQRLRKTKISKLVRHRLFTVAAAAVVFMTTYALILPAITRTTETTCGLEEHTHTEDCYTTEKVLTCTLEESDGHVHSDSCYQDNQVLVCGQEESDGHVHTESCYDADGQMICGMEEGEGAHHHTDACYQTEKVLICGMEEGEGAHHHTDACYTTEKVLTCTKEEHTHTAECYADTSADVESEASWTNTFRNVVLTGNWAEDTAAIAKTQIGYTESTKNYIVDDDGEKQGYTRYGAWYGDTYAEWCAMFSSFCINYAGVPTSTGNAVTAADGTLVYMPIDEGCQNWITKLNRTETPYYYAVNDQNSYSLVNGSDAVCWNDPQQEIDAWKEAHKDDADYSDDVDISDVCSKYHPKAGDLIFFNRDDEADSDHVGLIESIDYNDAGSIERIRTIEGNSNYCVKENTYTQANTDIMGFGRMPENPNADTAKAAGADSAEDQDSEENMEEKSISVSVYTNAEYSDVISEKGITVTGKLPEGITGKAYPVDDVEVEGRKTLCAYDITLFDQDGNVYEPEEDASLDVKLSSDLLDEEDAPGSDDSEVYYIPESGDPEKIDTKTEDNGVTFKAEHFSTYAWTVASEGTLDAVYLNGTSGNDSNSGSSSGSAVKTFEKAVSLLKSGGTIYICGTVTISDDETWSLENSSAKIERYNTFTGALIEISSGGSLTLENIDIDGGCGKANSSGVAVSTATTVNSTYGTTSSGKTVQGPLISVLSGGNLVVNDGTVMENNSNKPNIVSNYPDMDNGYIGQGGAVYCQGTMVMNGGTIQYCEAESGGGVYVEGTGSSFSFNSGTIANNVAKDAVNYKYTDSNNRYRNAGGGVYLGEYANMTMTGGTITGNVSAREGGGISLLWLDRTNGSYYNDYVTTFTMLGGTISNNTACSTGGGLNITAGGTATVSAGTFTGNTAYGNERQCPSGSGGQHVYSGGAIYIDASGWNSSGTHTGVQGRLLIHRVLISNNTATEAGGGIASCDTSNVYVNTNSSLDLKDGTAIYGNTGYDLYLEQKKNVSPTTLGGGSYNWSQTQDGKYYTSRISSSDQSKAASLATVFIQNNTAYLGGGIGCNGIIIAGGDSATTSVSVTKQWDDQGYQVDHPDQVTVQLLQDGTPYGNPFTLVKSKDDDGNEYWPTVIVDDLPIDHTYTITETPVDGFTSSSNTDSVVIDTSWSSATSFTNGATYILKSSAGALANTSGDALSFMTVLEAEGDTAGQWVATVSGSSITFVNAKTGNTLGFFSSGSSVKASSSGASATTFVYDNSSRLYCSYGSGFSSNKYYLGSTITSGALKTSTSSTSGSTYTLYKKTTSTSGTAPTAIVVTNTTTVRSFTVQKQWSNDEEADRPSSVTVQLYQNDVAYGEVREISSSEGWTATWKNLPIKDSSGNAYTYTAHEVSVPAGYVLKSEGVDSDGTFSIVNEAIPTTSLAVVKAWVGDEAEDRPESITVQLKQNGEDYGDPVTITASDNWAHTFTKLPVQDDDGNTYVYTAVETSGVAGYITTYPEVGDSGPVLNENGQYVITNTCQSTGFTVQKQWEGDAEADRPESIQVQLYQNGKAYGQPQTLNSAGSWKYRWKNLPLSDEDGNAYEYTAAEVSVPDGYYSLDTENGPDENGNWIIVNRKNEMTSVSVRKEWNTDSDHPTSVTVHLYQNGEVYGDSIELKADTTPSWYGKWEELPKYDSTGTEYVYTVGEEAMDDYEAVITTSEDGIVVDQEYWQEVSSPSSGLSNGDQILLMSSSGTVLGSSGGSLAWVDAPSDLQKATDTSSDAIWTYDNSSSKGFTLKNQGAKTYLYVNKNSSFSYEFVLYDSGSYFSWKTNNKIYQSDNIQYYGGTSSSVSTSTPWSSSATSFTVYKRAISSQTYQEDTNYVIKNYKKSTISKKYIFPVLQKTWKEVEDSEIPDSIQVTVSRPDGTVGSYTLSKDNNWTCNMALADAGYSSLEEYYAANPTGLSEDDVKNYIVKETGEMNGSVTIDGQNYDVVYKSSSADPELVIYNGEVFYVYNYNFEIENTKNISTGYVLPETGGSGTLPYTAAGMILMTGAAAAVLLRRKSRREQL